MVRSINNITLLAIHKNTIFISLTKFSFYLLLWFVVLRVAIILAVIIFAFIEWSLWRFQKLLLWQTIMETEKLRKTQCTQPQRPFHQPMPLYLIDWFDFNTIYDVLQRTFTARHQVLANSNSIHLFFFSVAKQQKLHTSFCLIETVVHDSDVELLTEWNIFFFLRMST